MSPSQVSADPDPVQTLVPGCIAPAYISDLISPDHTGSRPLRSSEHLLAIPRSPLKTAEDGSFSVAAPFESICRLALNQPSQWVFLKIDQKHIFIHLPLALDVVFFCNYVCTLLPVFKIASVILTACVTSVCALLYDNTDRGCVWPSR